MSEDYSDIWHFLCHASSMNAVEGAGLAAARRGGAGNQDSESWGGTKPNKDLNGQVIANFYLLPK